MQQEEMSFIRFIATEMMKWSLETRGPTEDLPRRQAGLIEHIRKEVEEIKLDPDDIVEYADVFLLGVDAAWRATRLVELAPLEVCFAYELHTGAGKHMLFADIDYILKSLAKHPHSALAAAGVMVWAREMAESAGFDYPSFEAAVREKFAIVKTRQYPPAVEGEACGHIRDTAA